MAAVKTNVRSEPRIRPAEGGLFGFHGTLKALKALGALNTYALSASSAYLCTPDPSGLSASSFALKRCASAIRSTSTAMASTDC